STIAGLAGPSLGVRQAIRANTAGKLPALQPSQPSVDDVAIGREPTLSARARSVQPPDVARQAMSELGVLARELATLPEQIEESGLARTHRATYFDAVEDYLRLARLAWESVAEERLEQSGADPEYRPRAIIVARRVSQLQQEHRAAHETAQFTPPRRRPFLWRRRVGLVRTGLRTWQERLTPIPDPLSMGRGLFLLRGYLGLASAGTFALLLLDLLVGAALALVALTGLGLVLLLIGAIAGASTAQAVGLAGGVIASVLAGVLVYLLGVRGPAPLGLLLGASVFAPTHTTRNISSGASLIAGALRIWWLLVGVIALPALLLSFASGGLLFGTLDLPAQPGGSTSLVTFGGGIVTLSAALPALLCLAALALLAIPALLVALVRFTVEVGGSPSWVPAARRYALAPALLVLATLTGALLVGIWLGTDRVGWRPATLVE